MAHNHEVLLIHERKQDELVCSIFAQLQETVDEDKRMEVYSQIASCMLLRLSDTFPLPTNRMVKAGIRYAEVVDSPIRAFVKSEHPEYSDKGQMIEIKFLFTRVLTLLVEFIISSSLDAYHNFSIRV